MLDKSFRLTIRNVNSSFEPIVILLLTRFRLTIRNVNIVESKELWLEDSVLD